MLLGEPVAVRFTASGGTAHGYFAPAQNFGGVFTISSGARRHCTPITSQEPLMLAKFTKLARNEDGATAIEYGLIAALIAVAAIAAFQLVGSNLSTVFHNIATQL